MKFSDIGVKGKQIVRDLWEHSDKGIITEVYSSKVAPQGVFKIKISNDK